MRTIKYISAVILLPVLFFMWGCSKPEGGESQPGNDNKPSIQTSAKVRIVTTLSDASLFQQASASDAIGKYVNDIMKDETTLVILERTDAAGVSAAAKIALDSYKWTCYAVQGQKSASEFAISTIYSNEPFETVSSCLLAQSCYVTGISSSVSGQVKNIDADGNVTGNSTVSVTVPLYTCRFDTEAQISAFGGASGVMNTLKAAKRDFVIIGTVKNSLLTSLQSAVRTADSGYVATEVHSGSDYSIVMVYATRNWSFNSVSEQAVTGSAVAYTVDFGWK